MESDIDIGEVYIVKPIGDALIMGELLAEIDNKVCLRYPCYVETMQEPSGGSPNFILTPVVPSIVANYEEQLCKVCVNRGVILFEGYLNLEFTQLFDFYKQFRNHLANFMRGGSKTILS